MRVGHAVVVAGVRQSRRWFTDTGVGGALCDAMGILRWCAEKMEQDEVDPIGPCQACTPLKHLILPLKEQILKGIRSPPTLCYLK